VHVTMSDGEDLTGTDDVSHDPSAFEMLERDFQEVCGCQLKSSFVKDSNGVASHASQCA
jgi:hypothetical protein